MAREDGDEIERPDDDSTLRRIEIQYGVRVGISRISRGISLRGYFIASIFAANRSDAARGGGRMKFRHGSGVMNTLGELRAMRDPGSRVATPKNHALSLSLSLADTTMIFRLSHSGEWVFIRVA